MEDKMEKKLKAFLPYIIVIGVVYLLVPALVLIGSDAVSYIVLIGLLPLTPMLCCAHYSMNKESDFLLTLVAPIFFIPAMFLYRIAQTDFLKAVIYLIAYFLCGYLGLTIGDILANRKDPDRRNRSAERSGRSAERRSAPRERAPRERTVSESSYDMDEEPIRRSAPARRPAPAPVEEDVDDYITSSRRQSAPTRARRVAVEVEEPKRFEAADPYDDSSLDTSTTSDDIDAILREIHQRHANE